MAKTIKAAAKKTAIAPTPATIDRDELADRVYYLEDALDDGAEGEDHEEHETFMSDLDALADILDFHGTAEEIIAAGRWELEGNA